MALLLLSSSGAASGQGPENRGLFGPPVDVTLVEVAVVVEDSQGRPVSGLRQEDFQVLLDGEEVPVRTFEGPSLPHSEDASLSSWLLFIEPRFLAPGDLPDVLEALKAVLETDLPAGTLVSVVTASGGLEVLSPPTSDRADIGVQLEALAQQVSLGSLASGQGEIFRDIEKLVAEGRDSQGRDQDQAAQTILSRIRGVVAEGEREVAATAARLRQVVPLAAGLPGNSAIVYVTGRLPMRLEEALVQTWQSAFGRYSAWDADGPEQGAAAQGPVGRIGEIHGEQLFRDLGVYAASLGVTIHAVDAAALRASRSSIANPTSGGAGRSGALTVGRIEADEPQRLLAELTGGREAVGTRAFEATLGAAARDLSQRYLLGISPEGEEAQEQRLEVRLRGEDSLHLRHRSRVRIRNGDEQVAERTRAGLVLGSTSNPLQVEVEAGPPRPAGRGKQLIPLAVRLPLANLALVAEGKDHVGRVSVFATSGDLSRGIQPVQKSVLPVRVSNEDLLTSLARLVEYRFDLPVAAGEEAIAIGVRDDFAPATSILRIVPDGAEEARPARGPVTEEESGEGEPAPEAADASDPVGGAAS